jgi:hypothetical protein
MNRPNQFSIVTSVTSITSVLFATCLIQAGPAAAVSLKANFKLLGEVERFGIGYGEFNFSFNLNSTTLSQGQAQIPAGGSIWQTSGVFSALNLTGGNTQNLVELEFSIPFELDVGQDAALSLSLGGSARQMLIDFSNDIQYFNRGLPLEGDSRQQGLTLTSFTLADGTPLADAGLKLEFLPNNTLLRVSTSTNGSGIFSDEVNPPNKAQVLYPGGALTVASASVNPIINLSFSPEPNIPVIDFTEAEILPLEGLNNIRLTRFSSPPPSPRGIPEPTSVIGLLVFSVVGFLSRCVGSASQ